MSDFCRADKMQRTSSDLNPALRPVLFRSFSAADLTLGSLHSSSKLPLALVKCFRLASCANTTYNRSGEIEITRHVQLLAA